MSKSNLFETDLLEYVFQQTTIPYLTGSNLYVSLHTGDPGEAGSQDTNEATYTSYARVEVPRSTGSWDVTDNVATPTSVITFPQCTGGSESITYFAIGADMSGSGPVLYSGPVSPAIPVANGVTPQLLTGSSITED